MEESKETVNSILIIIIILLYLPTGLVSKNSTGLLKTEINILLCDKVDVLNNTK